VERRHTDDESTVDQKIVDQAFEDDAAVAAAEWGRDGKVEFRSDVETSSVSRWYPIW